MYKQIIRPILFWFSAETAHHLIINTLRVSKYIPFSYQLIKTVFFRKNKVKCMGLTFPNRVGLPAGMDKNAVVPKVFHALGFGFVEIGTVTPKSQTGNSKPRVFRIPKDGAIINRMGFNNDGMEVIAKRLKRYKKRKFILGGNIGKNTLTENKDAVYDYKAVLEKIYPLVDYIVLNVSCPNIADLKELQNRDYLSIIMSMMCEYRNQQELRKPFLIKISPDLDAEHITETIDLIKHFNFEGIVIANTTTKRDGLTISNEKITKVGSGGLSGKPLLQPALKLIKDIKQQTGDTVSIIASGGIFTPEDAQKMLQAGADLIQIYTGFIYEGIVLPKKLSKLHL